MKRLEDMTLEEKIGQMLLFGWQADDASGPSLSEGYPGTHKETAATALNSHARKLLHDWKVGGVILMGRNVESPQQVAALSNQIQEICDIPVFVSTDQEGGHVCRMKKPFTVMPGNMPLGAVGDDDLAYRAARAVGEELCAIGIHLDFAPCVDTNNNPDNPIIGVRSYGEDPRLVARLGAAQVRGYQDSGAIACVKHFPGHGDTAVDSHLGLARVPYPMPRLEEVELVPFRAAIEDGVEFVMTTHIIFEALDTERPATLSPAVVNGLLRSDMGFHGVVITDCMEMKAIADNWGTSEAAVMAVEAGVDIVAACHTLEKQAAMRQALLDAVRSGRITEDRINQSVSRILSCKHRYGLDTRHALPEDLVMTVVGSDPHLAIEQEIARRSITVVRDEAGLLPLRTEKALVVGPMEPAQIVGEALGADFVEVGPAFEASQLDVVRAKALAADTVVVLTKHREPWTAVPQNEEAQAAMVRDFVASGKPLVVVALRNPYDIRHFPEIPTYVCTYGYTRPSLEALADVLKGTVKPEGVLPVTLSGEASSPAQSHPHEDTTKWGFG